MGDYRRGVLGPQRTPEELAFLADAEKMERRKLSEQEANLWIAQAKSMGCL